MSSPPSTPPRKELSAGYTPIRRRPSFPTNGAAPSDVPRKKRKVRSTEVETGSIERTMIYDWVTEQIGTPIHRTMMLGFARSSPPGLAVAVHDDLSTALGDYGIDCLFEQSDLETLCRMRRLNKSWLTRCWNSTAYWTQLVNSLVRSKLGYSYFDVWRRSLEPRAEFARISEYRRQPFILLSLCVSVSKDGDEGADGQTHGDPIYVVEGSFRARTQTGWPMKRLERSRSPSCGSTVVYDVMLCDYLKFIVSGVCTCTNVLRFGKDTGAVALPKHNNPGTFEWYPVDGNAAPRVINMF